MQASVEGLREIVQAKVGISARNTNMPAGHVPRRESLATPDLIQLLTATTQIAAAS